MSSAMHSPYMHWAKTRFQAAPRYGLTNSGVFNFPLRELQVSLDDIELSGPSYYGYPPLMDALARHARVEKDSIVAATGTSGANYLAMVALLKAGDDCLVERPAYDPMFQTASFVGANIVRFDRLAEEGFQLNLELVQRALTPKTRLIVLTNLHNPSNALIDQETLRGLAALAREAKARVLIDEVYLEALFEDSPGSAYLLDPVFVSTNSLTKAYGLSGLRCGWILAEPALARQMWLMNDLMGVIPAHSAERLSCLVFAQFDRVVARSKALLGTNRRLIHDFLRSRPELEGGLEKYGTVSFPRLNGIEVGAFCDHLLAKYETSLVPGEFFEAPEHFRVGFGCATETLVAGLERMGMALDELGRK